MITKRIIKNLRKLGFLHVMVMVFILAFLASAPPWAHAQMPRYINYQGKLTDADDNPVTGDVSVTLRLYDAESGGTALWTEAQSATVTRGIFSILLGSTTVLDDLDFNSAYWYSVEVESDGEMTPRQRLTAVGYAMNADTLDGYDSSDFLKTSPSGDLSLTGGANEDIEINPTGTGNVIITIDSTSGDFKVTDGTTNWLMVDNETGNVTIAQDLTVGGTIYGSFASEDGDSTFTTITVTGASDLRGNILSSTGALTIADTLTQTGASNQVTLAGNLDANNGVDVTGALTVSGATTLSSALDMNANVDLDYSGTSAALDVNQASTGAAAQFTGGRVLIGADTSNAYALSTGELYVQGDLEVDGKIYGDIIGSGSQSLGDTTLSSLTVTGASDIQGNVADSAGTYTIADNIDVAPVALTSGGTDDYALNIAQTLNDTDAAGGSDVYRGIKVNVTETNTTGWNNVYLMDLQVDEASKFRVDNSGNVTVSGTVDGVDIAALKTAADLDYDAIGDLPTAAVADGATTTIATGDQIYDFITGGGYISDDTSVPKGDLVNSGTLGFDWADDEVADTLTLTAGSIDGVTIGATTPAAATVTGLTMKNTGSATVMTFNDGTVSDTFTYDSTADQELYFTGSMSAVDFHIRGSSPAVLNFGQGANTTSLIYDPATDEIRFSRGTFAQDYRNKIKNASFESFSAMEEFHAYDAAYTTATDVATDFGGMWDKGSGFQGGWENFAPDDWNYVSGSVFQHAPLFFETGFSAASVDTDTFTKDYAEGVSAVRLAYFTDVDGVEPDNTAPGKISQTIKKLKPSTVYSVGVKMRVETKLVGGEEVADGTARIDIEGEDGVVANPLDPKLNAFTTIATGGVDNKVKIIPVGSVQYFPPFGIIQISSNGNTERIRYEGLDDTQGANKFLKCTRGANGTGTTVNSRTVGYAHAAGTKVIVAPFVPIETSTQTTYKKYEGQFATDPKASDITLVLSAEAGVAYFDTVQVISGGTVPDYGPNTLVDTGDQTVYGTLRIGRSSDEKGGILSVDKFVRTRGVELFTDDPGLTGTSGGGGMTMGGGGIFPPGPGWNELDFIEPTVSLHVSGAYSTTAPPMRDYKIRINGAKGETNSTYTWSYMDSSTGWVFQDSAAPVTMSMTEQFIDGSDGTTPGVAGVKVKFSATSGKAGDTWYFNASNETFRDDFSFAGTSSYTPGKTRIYVDPEISSPYYNQLVFEDGITKVSLADLAGTVATPASLGMPLPIGVSSGGLQLYTSGKYTGLSNLIYEVRISSDGTDATPDTFQWKSDNPGPPPSDWSAPINVSGNTIFLENGIYIYFTDYAGTFQSGTAWSDITQIGDKWSFNATKASSGASKVVTLNDKSDNVVLEGGTNVTIDNSGANIIINASVGDAVTLDSIDSLSFLRSDTNDSVDNNSTLNIDAGSTLSIDGAWDIGGVAVASTLTATELNMLDGETDVGTSILTDANILDDLTIATTSTAGIVIGEDKTAPTANTAGKLKFFSAGNNALYTTFTAGTQTDNADYILPTASTNGLLKNASGTLSWDGTSYITGIAWGGVTGTLSSQTDLSDALALKAPLADPALTGTPTAPTATAGDNDTSIATTAFVKSAVDTGIAGLSWKEAALDYITNNTLVPPNETTGNRYVLAKDGGAPHANWDGAVTGDMVQFNGSSWVKETPQDGDAVFIEDVNTGYVYTGTIWTPFTGATAYTWGNGLANTSGTTIDVQVGNGIQITSDAVAMKLNATSGLVVDGDGLALADAVAGTGLTITDKVIAAVDTSATNELNIFSGDLGDPTAGTAITIAGGTNATSSVAGDTVTIDVDDAFVKNSVDDIMAGTLTIQTTTPSDLIIDNSTVTADADSGYITLRGNDYVNPTDTELDMSVFLDVTSTTDYKLSIMDDGKSAEIASLDESGNLQLDGDAIVSGGAIDLGSATNQAGSIVLYDGDEAGGETLTIQPSAIADDGSWTMKLPAAIASGESFLKMGADGVIDYDESTYATGNDSISLTGDVSGTGTTSIATTIGANKVNDTHIDWGIGANQVSADDIGNGVTNAIITLTQETNFGTAYTHSTTSSGTVHGLTIANVSQIGQTIESAEITDATIAAADIAQAAITKAKLSELAPSADGTGKTISIAAGDLYVSGNTLKVAAAATANFASGGNCEYDPTAASKYIKGLIVMASDGSLSLVTTGSSEQDARATVEAHTLTYPDDKIAVAEVVLYTTETAAGSIANIEALGGGADTKSYIYRDVRPFLNLGGSQAFKTVSVSGQSDVVADAIEDSLIFAAGDNITITTDASTDTVTITAGGAIHDQNTDTGTTSQTFEIDNDATAGLILSASGLTTADKTFTFPDTAGEVATIAATQTMSNKTLTNPIASQIYGSAAANGDINIDGTSHATKDTSYVLMQSGGGNVGIGTDAPAQVLDVNGNIIANHIISRGGSPATMQFGTGPNAKSLEFDIDTGEFSFTGGKLKQAFQNLVRDGNFESYRPSGWYSNRSYWDSMVNTSYYKYGTQSLQVYDDSTGSPYYMRYYIPNCDRLRGNDVTISVWARCHPDYGESSTSAKASVGISAGGSVTSQDITLSYNTTNNANTPWRNYTFTYRVPTNAYYVHVSLYGAAGAETGTAQTSDTHSGEVTGSSKIYYDGVTLVEGKLALEYGPSPIYDTGDQVISGNLAIGANVDPYNTYTSDYYYRYPRLVFGEPDSNFGGYYGGWNMGSGEISFRRLDDDQATFMFNRPITLDKYYMSSWNKPSLFIGSKYWGSSDNPDYAWSPDDAYIKGVVEVDGGIYGDVMSFYGGFGKSANLLTYSEDFLQPAWVADSGLTVTSGFSAPDGANTACNLQNSLGYKDIKQEIDCLGNTTYTFSVYVAPSSSYYYTCIYLKSDLDASWSIKYVDLYNTSSTTPWRRFAVQHTTPSGATKITARIEVRSYQSIKVWGAQLAEGLKPSVYLKTTSAAINNPTALFHGDGSGLTNLAATNMSGTSAITGITGNTFTINEDLTGTPSEDLSFTFNRGTGTDATVLWDESATRFDINQALKISGTKDLTVTGQIVAGSGSNTLTTATGLLDATKLSGTIDALRLPSDGYSSTYVNVGSDTMTGKLTINETATAAGAQALDVNSTGVMADSASKIVASISDSAAHTTTGSVTGLEVALAGAYNNASADATGLSIDLTGITGTSGTEKGIDIQMGSTTDSAINTNAQITAGTLTDGTANISGGAITGLANATVNDTGTLVFKDSSGNYILQLNETARSAQIYNLVVDGAQTIIETTTTQVENLTIDPASPTRTSISVIPTGAAGAMAVNYLDFKKTSTGPSVFVIDANGNPIIGYDGAANYLYFEDGAETDDYLAFDDTNDRFVLSNDISVTGDVGGTTIGGIAQANLVDKAATETISGAWSFGSGALDIAADGTLDFDIDTAGYYTAIDFSTGSALNDANDYYMYMGTTDYWKADGAFAATSASIDGTLEAATLSDGTASITGGGITGVGAITATGTIEGGTLSDGTASITSGDITGVGAITMSGNLTGSATLLDIDKAYANNAQATASNTYADHAITRSITGNVGTGNTWTVDGAVMTINVSDAQTSGTLTDNSQLLKLQTGANAAANSYFIYAVNSAGTEMFKVDKAGNLYTAGTQTIVGSTLYDGTQIIDVSNSEAFLVRQNADPENGDVFIVNTTSKLVGINTAPAAGVELDVLGDADFSGTLNVGTNNAFAVGATGNVTLVNNATLDGVDISDFATTGSLDHTKLSNIGTNTHTAIDTHIAGTGSSVHGLGTISTQAADDVLISGGSITGISALGVTSGAVSVDAGQKLNVEGAAGDTYMQFNSTTGKLEIYVNNEVVAYIKN